MTTDYHFLSDQLERAYATRLALRPIALADAWPLHIATRNPAFNEFLLWDQPANEAETLARVDGIVQAARRGRLAAMSAVVRDTGEWTALFRFQTYAANPDWVEMGIWMHDRFWGGRYSLELGRLCVDAAFAASDIGVLVGASAPGNRSSCRLMELCGLQAGQLVYRRTEAGTEVPLQEFTITRAQWQSAAPGRHHLRVADAAPAAVPPPASVPVPQIRLPAGEAAVLAALQAASQTGPERLAAQRA